jgi:hypothetical protein
MATLMQRLRGDRPGADSTVDELSEQLRAEQENNLLAQESIADLQLALEDLGWRRLATQSTVEFERSGLRTMTDLCRLMAIKNPLIGRGLRLRQFYVWGLGLSVNARSTGPDRENAQAQDVNVVVQAFLDDPGNRAALTGEQAREENERALGTDGNLFLTCFTDPLTGRVQVRAVPFDEIDDVIANPDDRSDPWYYRRRWMATVIDPTSGAANTREQIAYYPALGYRPRPSRPRVIDGHEVHWDAPMRHVRVNGLRGWKFGLPDAYAAIDWARAYKEFLTDWARLVKGLSRFAYQTKVDGSKTKRAAAAAALEAAPTFQPRTREPDYAGATAVTGPGTFLEAVPKTGATIDSGSGRPLAMMVAAALDVPVTMLLSDPGQTGARATAKTLDRPTELMAEIRRSVWTAALRDVLTYVVTESVRAPRGPLKGSITRDAYTGLETVQLAGDTDATVDISWPDLDEADPESAMKALQVADQMDVVPPLVIARLVLQLLRVSDVDEILEDLVDEEGNFVPPAVSAGQVAVDAFRSGGDPAAAVGGEPSTHGTGSP